MAINLKRRTFIKIMGGTLAGAGAIGLTRPEQSEAEEQDVLVTKTPTVCEICFWKCAGWVYQRDGKPWKIEGNPEDPHCKGRLCPRGTGGMGSYTDPDRLKKPLIRVDERGKQVFREASWDEALQLIAEKMKIIKKNHGAEAVTLFSHGTGGKWFKHMLKAYGSQNIAAPSYAQCRGPREEAFKLTFGETVGSPERTDIRNCRCMALIGSHLGENMHNGQVQEFTEMHSSGGTVITVDPRYSTAASKSKYWLPIRPGTDLALLLAWIHVIIKEKRYDEAYVDKYTTGLEALKEAVEPYTPEWAFPITTIKPCVIRDTARELTNHAPASMVHPGRFSVWYGDDTQRCRAVAIINALLGAWGRRGGFYFPNKVKLKKFPVPTYPKPSTRWYDSLDGQFPFASMALASGLCDATIPYPNGDHTYRGWIVYGSNLLKTLPQKAKTLEAIQGLDLLVVVDTMPAEITGYADVILPECTYLERYDDIRTSPHREPVIALRTPAFEPMYDSKPGWWIARELGIKLGLEQYFPWDNIEDYLSKRLESVGVTLDEMKKKGVIRIGDADPLYLEEDEDFEFNTDSGKIELYSELLLDEGFDPVPKFTKHKEPEPGFFRLLSGRAPMHSFTRTVNNPVLMEVMDENEVWLNTDMAHLNGIEDGQLVRLENQDGIVSNSIKVKVTQRIRQDCVYMVHGFGRTQRQMKRSYMRGADDAELTTRVAVDPIMGGTGMRVNFVKLIPEEA